MKVHNCYYVIQSLLSSGFFFPKLTILNIFKNWILLYGGCLEFLFNSFICNFTMGKILTFQNIKLHCFDLDLRRKKMKKEVTIKTIQILNQLLQISKLLLMSSWHYYFKSMFLILSLLFEVLGGEGKDPLKP